MVRMIYESSRRLLYTSRSRAIAYAWSTPADGYNVSLALFISRIAIAKVSLHGAHLTSRIDEVAQPSAASWFGADADTGRPKVWRELGVSGVGEL